MATSKQDTLQYKNFLAYLKTFRGPKLDRIYEHPSACLVVFRKLPELSQHYILRLLFIDQAIPQSIITSWVSEAHIGERSLAVENLNALYIWKDVSNESDVKSWCLNPVFRQQLNTALYGNGVPWILSTSDTFDVDFLNNYAVEKWESILYFMAASNYSEIVSEQAKEILVHSRLMVRNSLGKLSITKLGFQFLLMDIASQVWHFLVQYLKSAKAHGLDRINCIGFLCKLSFSTVGREYSTDGLSSDVLVFMQHLREFGLIYQKPSTSGCFCTTFLASYAVSNKNSIQDYSGFIYIETTFKIYAYTKSKLHESLLGLFCEITCRLPNLCVGEITHESVTNALEQGISAAQIISYLQMNLHPEYLRQAKRYPIPMIITDQIQLWEMQQDRPRILEMEQEELRLSEMEQKRLQLSGIEQERLQLSGMEKEKVRVSESKQERLPTFETKKDKLPFLEKKLPVSEKSRHDRLPFSKKNQDIFLASETSEQNSSSLLGKDQNTLPASDRSEQDRARSSSLEKKQDRPKLSTLETSEQDRPRSSLLEKNQDILPASETSEQERIPLLEKDQGRLSILEMLEQDKSSVTESHLESGSSS